MSEKVLSVNKCPWSRGHVLLEHYHDTEWGIPVHDDTLHFEMLTLEGAQAGLNWLTILKKREHYRQVFHGFEPDKIANMTDEELDLCLQNKGIIRNSRKVYSVRKNAIAFLEIQQQFGSFDDYIWQQIGEQQLVNTFELATDVPAQTAESNKISKDLKKRGMSFVGPTIIYSYLQAAGLVNDHLTSCWRYDACR